jgi:hypothetical protein
MSIDSKNVVNEVFWANFAGEKIYNSFDLRIKAVDKLQNFVTWVFGLFSTSGFIVVFFTQGDIQHGALVCWGIGLALILVGSFFSQEAGFPIKEHMDPNLTSTVRKAFNDAMARSDVFFRLAVYTVMSGTFMIAFGIIVQFWEGKPTPPLPGKWQISGYVEKTSGGYLVPFSVQGKPNHEFQLLIRRASDTTSSVSIFNTQDSLLLDKTFTSDSAGNYSGVYAIPTSLVWATGLCLTVSAPGEAGRFEVAAAKVRLGPLK